MKKILILQKKVPHYRKAFYNELSKRYEVTSLHSGDVSVGEGDLYKEIIVKYYKIGAFYYQKKVFKEVRSKKYDVIVAMIDLQWVNNIIASYIVRKNTQFIWWGAWFTGNKLADKMRLYLLNRKHSTIFYDKKARDTFINKGVNASKLYVANNTFDVGKRNPSYINKFKNCILFVGSFDKRKQLDLLIKAYKNIHTKINNIELVIVGDGQEKERLYQLVHELGIKEKVKFKGQINDSNVLKDIYNSSIVSVSFGQAGLSVLQSLGFGVPFITRKDAISGGEITNIKDGYNGILCDNTIHSLEEAIFNVCTNLEYAQKLGENAYNYYSEHCTVQIMAKGFIESIENNK